jgi:hypothetical protein
MDSFIKSSYVGDKLEDWAHGNGTHTFPDGSKYVGSFVKGHFHGQGKIVYTDGSCVEGVWEAGKLVERRMVFADGLEFRETGWDYCTDADRRFHIERQTQIQPLDQTLLSNDPSGLKTIKPGHYGDLIRDSGRRF